MGVVVGVVELVLADVAPEVPGLLGCMCRRVRRRRLGLGAAELDGRHGRCERVLDLVRGLGLVLRLGLGLRRVKPTLRLMVVGRAVEGVKGLLLMQMVRAHREGGGRVDERGHVVCRYRVAH